ncbi:LOW QUALITY PROTEIN: peroxisome biogenesis protein 16 [Curcuma longa]|uniref:LOW QUALITY PROTEIN: peroxisome biogenesis protein 16 n=1 Tax=Curcuma longa TaxID=136217 RepID=UPI003D9F0888
MLKDAETVVEVAAEHFVGEKHKWNYLALTEAVKAFVRLASFRDSGYKILLQGGEIVNSDERVSEDYNRRIGDATMAGGSNIPGYIHERYGAIPQNLEGRAISALSCFGENAKMLSDQVWLNKLHRGSQTAVAKQTLSTVWFQKGLSGQLFLSGEVLFILRPLIYVLFIRRCGIQSWKPWLISLAIDLAGMSFLSFATNSQPRNGDNYYHLSSSEKDEMKRRKLVWALYIMRDPFFSKYTKHRLEKTDKYLSRVPLIGFLTAKLVELIVGAQTRYTYTSGS